MAANWRRKSWYLDSNALDILADKLAKIPDRSEEVMNKYLHGKGIEKSSDTINRHIPVSHWEGRTRNKKHARQSQALKGEGINLGFIIRPKPAFNYIKYPDLGIGQSKRNQPEKFMEKGLEMTVPEMVEDLEKEILKEIDKTLGGN